VPSHPDHPTAGSFRWTAAEAASFAAGQATSDYHARVGGALQQLLGPVPELLDVGAGTGVLGRLLLARGGRYTAIEPNHHLARRCADGPGTVHEVALEQALTLVQPHGTVLCANIPGLVDDPRRRWSATWGLTSQRLVWVIPAQRGPRSWCLAGFLPRTLHGEDTTPGHRLALTSLAGWAPRPLVRLVDWTWRVVAGHRDDLVALCARHLPADHDHDRLVRHVYRYAVASEQGWQACARKRSALAIWTRTNPRQESP
jgi:uncharacterized protein YndB with AHSA1/START domain